ncbi:MAG: phage baseplate assembly protein V [Steroidobacteraceae bacterium]
MNDALLNELLERIRGRFYGKYRGSVTDVDADTMRIKASVPSVLPGATTGWCMACVPYAGPDVGVVMLPEVGSGVWIEFEGGDVSYPIWVGCYWRSTEVPSEASATVKSIITQAGSVALDDDAGSITLTDAQQNTVVLDSDGVTSTSGSSTVAIGADGVSVNDGALEVT